MAETQTYTLELLQAINSWQSGGDPKKKGLMLKEACATLPSRLRQCSLVCFRQIALPKGGVWQLFTKDNLPEKISSWTLDPEVAKSFKGGVPPAGDYQGVIFCIAPQPNSVIINLNAVYHDPLFEEAIGCFEKSIDRFSSGIGRYWNNQSEVVLEIGLLTENEIWSLGGYSSSRAELINRFYNEQFGRMPSSEESIELLKAIDGIENQPGPSWTKPDRTPAILEKLRPAAKKLKEIDSAQKRIRNTFNQGQNETAD